MADLIKNIQRISWRFAESKSFLPNENDIKAFNEIIEWINAEKEQRINENRYFAKMVVYCYINELRFYKENVLSEKKIQEVLDLPLGHWYEQFQSEMNSKELNEMLEFLDIKDQWEVNKKESGVFDIDKVRETAKANRDIIKENEDKIVKIMNGVWTSDQITDKLNFFITELLNRYGNKP